MHVLIHMLSIFYVIFTLRKLTVEFKSADAVLRRVWLNNK